MYFLRKKEIKDLVSHNNSLVIVVNIIFTHAKIEDTTWLAEGHSLWVVLPDKIWDALLKLDIKKLKNIF